MKSDEIQNIGNLFYLWDDLFSHHLNMGLNYEEATAEIIKQKEAHKMSAKEKVLAIKLAGHNAVYAYKNKEREGNQPHYKGDGVAVWINDKKEKVQEIQIEEEEIL